MHNIHFYRDPRGQEPVLAYIKSVAERSDKASRIKANKIRDYIKYLRVEGLNSGAPYVKHLDDEIWELRPLKDRILFASWQDDGFIFLHHFVKKTQKIPQRELKRAKRNLKKYKELTYNA